MAYALVNGWHAAVRVGLGDRVEASLVLAAVQPRLQRVYELATQALEGSRPERSKAIESLLEFADVDSLDLCDYLVAAVKAGIQEVASAEQWGDSRSRAIEKVAVDSVLRFDRQISALEIHAVT